jgi:hypothetical protein
MRVIELAIFLTSGLVKEWLDFRGGPVKRVLCVVAPDRIGCANNPVFVTMDGDFDRQETLVKKASGILAAGEGSIKPTQAMIIVGFTTPERKNMKLYMQVVRRSKKVCIMGPEELEEMAQTVVVTVEDAATLSSLTGPNSRAQTSGNTVASASSSVEGAARRPLFSPTATVGSILSRKTNKGGKKTRVSSKELQRKHAIKCKATMADKLGMKQATTLIARSKGLPVDKTLN